MGRNCLLQPVLPCLSAPLRDRLGAALRKVFLGSQETPQLHPGSQEEFWTRASPAACVEDPGAPLELMLPQLLHDPGAIPFPLLPREFCQELGGKTTVPRSAQCCTQSYLKQRPPFFWETLNKPSCRNDGLSSPSAGLQMRRTITPLGVPQFLQAANVEMCRAPG